MKNEERFNKIFNAFILVGMAACVILTCIGKMASPDVKKSLLLLSAFGTLMGVMSSVLSAKGSIWTFLFGLLDVSIYGAMCLVSWKNGASGLGTSVLHFVYFVPMQFVGFFQWRKRGASGHNQVNARRLTPRQWAQYLAILLAGGIVAYLVIARFDKSAAETFIKVTVLLDVLPMMFNILGQLLMSMAYREQWIFWIGVNVFSIAMWSNVLIHDPGNDFAIIYVIKYAFYLINALNGLRIWSNLSKKQIKQ